MVNDPLPWLRSCKCQQYNCNHKQAADELEFLRAEVDRLQKSVVICPKCIDGKMNDAIDNLLDEIDNFHQPEWYSEESRLKGDNPLYCRTCGAQEGSWPCVHRMVLNELKEARRG